MRRLTREACDRLVGIPLAGSVESLNVSVASGICLYATRRARHTSRRDAFHRKSKTPCALRRTELDLLPRHSPRRWHDAGAD